MGASSTSRALSGAARIALGSAAAFALWTIAVVLHWTDTADRAVLAGFVGIRNVFPILSDSAWLITRLGDGITRAAIALIGAVLLWCARRRTAAIWLLIAIMGGMALSSLCKALIDRPRPDVGPLLDSVHNASYPSGHAMGAITVALAIAIVARARWIWPLAGLYVGLIAVSRLILGVHWPSDIAGGLLLGLMWVCGWRAIAQQRDWHRTGD